MAASFRFSFADSRVLGNIVEMVGWLPDNLPGERCTMTSSGASIIVEIPDDADAIMFKMKWQELLTKTDQD